VQKLNVWVRKEKEEKEEKDEEKSLGWPIDQIWAQAHFSPHQAQKSKAQLNLGPRHIQRSFHSWVCYLYLPDSAVFTRINSWALHLRPKSSVQFLNTWLSRPPAPDDKCPFSWTHQ
jgi:hypothetical protein